MKYTVTPFALTSESVQSEPLIMFSRIGKHVVFPVSGYNQRMTFDAFCDDPHEACEAAWATFQNIDEDRQTPDGGRSLMVGDLVRIEADGNTEWWICCSFGWEKTVAPGDARQDIEE